MQPNTRRMFWDVLTEKRAKIRRIPVSPVSSDPSLGLILTPQEVTDPNLWT